jgi:hypothetical protein
MLRALLRRQRHRPVDSAQALGRFLDRSASLIAQKSVIGYCQVKSMLPVNELLREKLFADAFEISRWEGYVAILADLVVVAEGRLRPATPGRDAALVEPLLRVFAETLASHPMPVHRPQGWADAVDALRARLLQAQLVPPASMAQIAQSSAERLYATLPIHESLRAPDKPAIMANVQFMMVGLAHEFESQLDVTALAAELVG